MIVATVMDLSFTVSALVDHGTLMVVMMVPLFHHNRRPGFVMDDNVAAAVQQLSGGKDSENNGPLCHDGTPPFVSFYAFAVEFARMSLNGS
jgi:hypothetical protein